MLSLPLPHVLIVASLLIAVVASLLFAVNAASAEVNYPAQTVRLISAFAAGGGNDLMARELAYKFGEEWKKSVIVEDKPGGNGDIATSGLSMTHVPYNGVAPAFQDVVGGHIDLMFASIITAKPLVDGGLVRGLLVTSTTQSPFMPDLPTKAEFPGFETFDADLWYGLLAPANTDPAIVDNFIRRPYIPSSTPPCGNALKIAARPCFIAHN